MKRHFNRLWDLIELTHPVEDWKYYPDYHQFNYCRTIDLQEVSQEEDSLEEGDSQEEEYLEEVGDIQEAEAHLELDPLEEGGVPRPSKYRNHNKESW